MLVASMGLCKDAKTHPQIRFLASLADEGSQEELSMRTSRRTAESAGEQNREGWAHEFGGLEQYLRALRWSAFTRTIATAESEGVRSNLPRILWTQRAIFLSDC